MHNQIVSAKDKVKTFLEKKNILIKNHTKLDYINNEDLEDIESWGEEGCTKFINELHEIINNYGSDDIADGDICPWCCFYFPNCLACSYGKRHEICSGRRGIESNSLYTRIIRVSPNFKINEIPGMSDITCELFEGICFID